MRQATTATLALPMFVPGDRPDRFQKAFHSGADAVIVDLEDAVGLDHKGTARRALAAARDAIATTDCPVIVRVNSEDSPFHSDDLASLAGLQLAAVMVPNVEGAKTIGRVAAITGRPIVALIESARGLAAARAVAAAGARLAFGSIDFAVDLGCSHTREALLQARCELVLASRLGDAPPPLDGVTTSFRDPETVRDDASHAAALGFGGKLLIHPAQIAPAAAGLRPTDTEIAWAARVLAAGREGGAATLDGAMIDAPLRLRAEQIEQRAQRGRREPI